MTATLVTAFIGLDDTGVERWLTQLVDGVVDGRTALIVAVALAAGVGAAHALAPGHGKVLVGAWLLGGHGRRRDALVLGALVGVMHTASVVAIGLLLVGVGRAPASGRWPEAVIAVTGLAVAAVGLRTLLHHRRRRSTPATASVPDGPSRQEPLPATDPRPVDHHHRPPEGVAPGSRAGIVALAASGGLVPSPGALAMLATAAAVGRPLTGLLLVGVFGLGLGVTLTALGLVVLRGHHAIRARASDPTHVLARVAHRLPMLSAGAVVVAGLAIAASAILRAGA